MAGYLTLLKRNRDFRLLYIGQTISQLGDWFNTVAIYSLLLDLTGSATAVAWMLIVQMAPIGIVGPLAGVVVDRMNRRRIMIAADLLRGCVILGLLLVRRADQVWLAYAVTAIAVAAQAFFEPARTATIPTVTTSGSCFPPTRCRATWRCSPSARRSKNRHGDLRPRRGIHRQLRVVLRLGDLHRADAL